jgi:hypothetical protein
MFREVIWSASLPEWRWTLAVMYGGRSSGSLSPATAQRRALSSDLGGTSVAVCAGNGPLRRSFERLAL